MTGIKGGGLMAPGRNTGKVGTTNGPSNVHREKMDPDKSNNGGNSKQKERGICLAIFGFISFGPFFKGG